MIKVKRLLGARYLLGLHRGLTRVASALEAQTVVLERLADRLAPVDPPTDRAEVKIDTGVSYLDPIDAELAQNYVARTFEQTGHMPDEDEVLIYLADEKTTDLHTRLVQRDQELARLSESRS